MLTATIVYIIEKEWDMLDRLRDQLADYLKQHRVGVLCTSNGVETWALPVAYQSNGLILYCAVPCWSDAAYYLRTRMAIQLIIPAASDGVSWLCYQGEAQVVTGQDDGICRDELHGAQAGNYLQVRVEPRRLDLIDGRQGWGARETLEL
jgi:hypothetical protein